MHRKIPLKIPQKVHTTTGRKFNTAEPRGLESHADPDRKTPRKPSLSSDLTSLHVLDKDVRLLLLVDGVFNKKSNSITTILVELMGKKAEPFPALMSYCQAEILLFSMYLMSSSAPLAPA
jgi:hypothetical protein